MKYRVVHTALQSNQPVDPKNTALGSKEMVQFKQDQHVTPTQLKEAGFDVEFLERNGAIEPLAGTEDDADRSPTTTHEATPHMATAPRGPGNPTDADEKVEFGDTSSGTKTAKPRGRRGGAPAQHGAAETVGGENAFTGDAGRADAAREWEADKR